MKFAGDNKENVKKAVEALPSAIVLPRRLSSHMQ